MSTDPTVLNADPALDVASIKEMMDGFDPASLLPELDSLLELAVRLSRFAIFIGPVILLGMGLAYLFLSPKEANYYFGYRCYFGMGSVHAWRFTQRLAGILYGGLGLVLVILMFLISGSFARMEVTDMVWKAVDCLVWQAVAVVLATLVINLSAAARFDRKGEFRKKKKK